MLECILRIHRADSTQCDILDTFTVQRWSHIKWRSNRLHRENISQHDELPFQLPNKTEGTHQISKSHLPFLSCSISSTLHSPKCSSQNLARLISTVDGWEDPSLTAANRLGRILFDGFTWKAALEVAVANTRNKMLVAFIVIVSGEMFGKDCFRRQNIMSTKDTFVFVLRRRMGN